LLALTLFLISVAGVSARVQTAAIEVTPERGNQFQTFSVRGTGFEPGITLAATFIAPDGEEFLFPVAGEQGLRVRTDGTFSVTVVPAVDFAGSRAGVWTASFCHGESGVCWTKEFTVSR